MINTQIDYDKDFYHWLMRNAALLRAKRFSEMDVENVAEELESMGKRDKRQLMSRLIVLLTHLLKWEFQPEKRSGNWRASIREQRLRIGLLLDDSPSLRTSIEEKKNEVYETALFIAADETGIDDESFPKTCPYRVEQMLDNEFYPDD